MRVKQGQLLPPNFVFFMKIVGKFFCWRILSKNVKFGTELHFEEIKGQNRNFYSSHNILCGRSAVFLGTSLVSVA